MIFSKDGSNDKDVGFDRKKNEGRKARRNRPCVPCLPDAVFEMTVWVSIGDQGVETTSQTDRQDEMRASHVAVLTSPPNVIHLRRHVCGMNRPKQIYSHKEEGTNI